MVFVFFILSLKILLFLMNVNHLLMMMLIFEFIGLKMMILFCMYLGFNHLFLCLMVLVLFACEASIGLSLLMGVVRMNYVNYVENNNVYIF